MREKRCSRITAALSWRVREACRLVCLGFAISLWTVGAPALALEGDPAAAPAAEAVRLTVLNAETVERYRRIFALQETGKWKAADRETKRLEDRILLGRVLFQRYMHPTKYRSQYKELASWLKRYADEAGASRIYRLALRRKPKAAKPPRRPGAGRAQGAAAAIAKPDPGYRSPRKRTSKQRSEVRSLHRHVAVHLSRRGDPEGAEKHLAARNVKKLLDPVEYDGLRLRIAAAYFFKGNDRRALALAAASAERSRGHVPLADWTAGLAAWRLTERSRARAHFSALARSSSVSPWNAAAGAFWAARAHLVTGEPGRVNELLGVAAHHPRTFYGLIATRLLARDVNFRWEPPPLSSASTERLLAVPEVRRAVALSQVDQIYWAEEEFRAAAKHVAAPLHGDLLGLAARLGLAAASLRLIKSAPAPEVCCYDSADYPLPRWQPDSGFRIDRALIYAFMRQESGFNSRAKSPSGARGLMQLMPRTGSYVAKDRSLRGSNRNKLYKPAFNMDLGQKYLGGLLASESIRGNLFLAAAAYNGGPGNLRKWLRRTNHRDDALLFIESIPALETRLFIERVMANFWIYREHLDQDTPSLDAVASGHWPYYFSLDASPFALVKDAQRARD